MPKDYDTYITKDDQEKVFEIMTCILDQYYDSQFVIDVTSSRHGHLINQFKFDYSNFVFDLERYQEDHVVDMVEQQQEEPQEQQRLQG